MYFYLLLFYAQEIMRLKGIMNDGPTTAVEGCKVMQ